MRLVGFNYTKIIAEKYSEKLDGLKIESSLNIDSIEEISTNKTKLDVTLLNFSFSSSVIYSKDIAKIELFGNMKVSIDPKKGKEILKDWKKKEIKEEIKLMLFNGILNKTNIKSLELEDELNLPPHFRLPSLTASKKE